MSIGDHQFDPAKPSAVQGSEKVGPEGLCLGRADRQAQDLTASLRVGANSDYPSDADDAPVLTGLEIGRIQPDEGPVTFDRALQKRLHPGINVLA